MVEKLVFFKEDLEQTFACRRVGVVDGALQTGQVRVL
jgi:hypothetical protein